MIRQRLALAALGLGIFALARAEETNPSTFMSLAIDKDGLLRGNYYDAVSDTTMNITGKVDKKTQRAAWTLGDKKTPVYEAGLSNLTQQQTTILVHRDGGKVEQMLLVRVQDGRSGLDGGALGVVLSHIDTPEDAKAAVNALRFPPLGHRSVGGSYAQLGFRGGSAKEVMPAIEAEEMTQTRRTMLEMRFMTKALPLRG